MNKLTTQCNKCLCHIRNCNIKRHINVCNGPKITKHPWHEWKIGNNLYKYPDGYEGNMAQIKLHMIHIDKGIKYPSRKGKNSSKYGKPAWNKGKTKETDERVLKTQLMLAAP